MTRVPWTQFVVYLAVASLIYKKYIYYLRSGKIDEAINVAARTVKAKRMPIFFRNKFQYYQILKKIMPYPNRKHKLGVWVLPKIIPNFLLFLNLN